MQLHGQVRQAAAFDLAERHHRLGCEPFEACERFAAAIAHRLGNVLGERHHPAVGERRAETKPVRDGRRHENRAWRVEGNRGGFEGHFAAAALDQ